MFSGTGNGMAKSLLDSVGEPCAAPNAVLAIIRGCTLCLNMPTSCVFFILSDSICKENFSSYLNY